MSLRFGATIPKHFTILSLNMIPGHPLWRGRVFRVRAEPSGALKPRNGMTRTDAESTRDGARWREMAQDIAKTPCVSPEPEGKLKFEYYILIFRSASHGAGPEAPSLPGHPL